MRLNRFLSVCGLGSRRGCEQIILDGRVTINGQKVTELGTQVVDADTVTVDGKPVHQKAGIVVALNKPRGYICTREDTHGRPTIYDLLPPRFQQLHHVGRLDQDSEGLILLTNQGDLSQRLMHPSEGVDKEYEVRVTAAFDQSDIFKLTQGMMTEEGFAKAERAWIENAYLIHVVLKQGLKRQIRHMFYQLGHEVERLTRIRIGGLKLHGMAKGSWRQMTSGEVDKLLLQPRPGSKGSAEGVKPQTVASSDDDHFASKPKSVRPARKVSMRQARPGSPRSIGPKPSAYRNKDSDKSFEPRASKPSGKRDRPSRDDDSFSTKPSSYRSKGPVRNADSRTSKPLAKRDRPAPEGRSSYIKPSSYRDGSLRSKGPARDSDASSSKPSAKRSGPPARDSKPRFSKPPGKRSSSGNKAPRKSGGKRPY